MYPEDLHYSAEHEWVRVEDGVAVVGITEYAQSQLGDIVYVSLPEPGDTLEPGSSIGELESTKSVSDVFAPVPGVVEARNDALEQTPELVNSDPYGAGWLIKIRLEDGTSFDDLMDAATYQERISS